MDRYAWVLFGAAALFNFAVAAALLFPPLQLGPWMGIPVVSGVELQIFNVAGALIACFGYGYWLVARNWRKFRPFLEYDGNRQIVTQSAREAIAAARPCPHHPVDQVGDPFW